MLYPPPLLGFRWFMHGVLAAFSLYLEQSRIWRKNADCSQGFHVPSLQIENKNFKSDEAIFPRASRDEMRAVFPWAMSKQCNDLSNQGCLHIKPLPKAERTHLGWSFGRSISKLPTTSPVRQLVINGPKTMLGSYAVRQCRRATLDCPSANFSSRLNCTQPNSMSRRMSPSQRKLWQTRLIWHVVSCTRCRSAAKVTDPESLQSSWQADLVARKRRVGERVSYANHRLFNEWRHGTGLLKFEPWTHSMHSRDCECWGELGVGLLWKSVRGSRISFTSLHEKRGPSTCHSGPVCT